MGKTVGTKSSQGVAYVFVRNGTTWAHQAKLLAADGAPHDFFGNPAIYGDTAVLGANQKTVGTNSGQGAAYVFVRNGTAWAQQARLVASDGDTDDRFGSNVAIAGETIVVASDDKRIGFNGLQGAAYVFERSGGKWSEEAILLASDGDAGDFFGSSVAITGNTIVVGASGKLVDSVAYRGAAYVFVRDGKTWTEQAKLIAGDGAENDWFGTSVAVDGDVAIVGSHWKPVGARPEQGAAYVFVRVGTTWTEKARLVASDGAANDHFGYDVAIAGETAVVGVEHKKAGTQPAPGAAYVFVPGSSVGDKCAASTECASGHCADGVCCDSECLGPCDVCAVSLGAPTDGKCSVAPTGYPGLPPCGAYVCTGSGVSCGKRPCGRDADCAAKFRCDTTTADCVAVTTACDGDHTLVNAEATPIDCAPYKCTATNVCLNRCTSRADCVAGMMCTTEGKCERASATEPTTESGAGCACRTARPTGSGAAVAALEHRSVATSGIQRGSGV
jgi:hypothetical protein